MTTKVCLACELELPLDQFTMKGKHRRARCRKCAAEANKLDRARYKDRERVNSELEYVKAGATPDPLAFSRAACNHVRLYVERAIERWERATEMEAPPHLTALRQISDGFVKEHPDHRCLDCGETIPMRQKRCAGCAVRRNRERTRLSNQRHREKKRKARLIQDGRLLVLRAEVDLMRLLRTLGLEWEEIGRRLGMSASGAYSKANYDPLTGGNPPASYLKNGLTRKTSRVYAPRQFTVYETLVCRRCESSYERLRTQGRKPHLCPSCRGERVMVAEFG